MNQAVNSIDVRWLPSVYAAAQHATVQTISHWFPHELLPVGPGNFAACSSHNQAPDGPAEARRHHNFPFSAGYVDEGEG